MILYSCTHMTTEDIRRLKHSFAFIVINVVDFAGYFLPARRYAIATCPSVCLSVRHAPVLCQNEES